MSSTHEQPKQSGANKPQVIVRAGKTYVCSACGTLVEIPEEFVGQFVLVANESPEESTSGEVKRSEHQEQEPRPEDATGTVDSQRPSVLSEEPQPEHSQSTLRPRSPQRPKSPKQARFAGQIIDGLQVPSARQLDLAFSWVTFHLTVLDRQGAECKRLQKLLQQHKKSRASCQSPTGHGKTPTVLEPSGLDEKTHEIHVDAEEDATLRHSRQPNAHAHQSVNAAPDAHQPKGREPP